MTLKVTVAVYLSESNICFKNVIQLLVYCTNASHDLSMIAKLLVT